MRKKQDNFMTITIYLAFCSLCIIGAIGHAEGLSIDLVFIDIIICAIAIIVDFVDRTEKKLEKHIDELYKNGILAEGDKK